MGVEIQNTNWSYDLTRVRLDKHGPRTSTDPDAACELIGWDGSDEGGLRPHPGFKLVDYLGPRTAGTDFTTSIQSSAYNLQPGDFYPISVRVNFDDYSIGYIYRVADRDNPSSSNCRIYFQPVGANVANNPSYSPTLIVSGTAAGYGLPMSVAVFGRLVYIFIKGKEPILMYWPSSWAAPTTQTDTGPGPIKILAPPDQAVALQACDPGATGAGQVVLLATTVPSTITYTGQSDSDVRQLSPGDYVFAYQLYNSVTGKRGPLTTIAALQNDSFDTGSGAVPQYAVAEITYPSNVGWTHASVYRSVRTQPAGGTFAAGVLFLDNFVQLSTHQAPLQTDLPTDYARVLWWYTLEDKALIYQDRYRDYFKFDDNMPKGGTASFYDNTLFVSDTLESAAPTGISPARTAAELRWSSTGEANPELFSAFGRYSPEVPSDVIHQFVRLGTNLIGFSANRQYLIRRESEYVKVMEMHTGFGCPSRFGATPLASNIYFATNKGLKSVDSMGQLDDIRATNRIYEVEWAGSLDSVILAFDPVQSVLYVLNRNVSTGRLVCYYLNTGRVVELYDATFRGMARGWTRSPEDESVLTNTVYERVLFVDDFLRVYTVDWTRSKTIDDTTTYTNYGGPRITTLDFDGDTIHQISAINITASTKQVPQLEDNVTVGRMTVTATSNLTEEMVGSVLYMLTPGNSQVPLGSAHQIVDIDMTNRYLYVYPNLPATVATVTSCVIGIGPVYCRWTGNNPGVKSEDGMTFKPTDFALPRTLSSIGVSCTDVLSNVPVTESRRFLAGVYRGNTETIINQNYSRDRAGNAIANITGQDAINYVAFQGSGSAYDGRHGPTGVALYPFFETFVPDLDFRALQVSVLGRVNANRTSLST